MSDNFCGEIRMFGGNYAPQGWALCQGQTLQISQYNTLYSLIGTTYGGDGVTTFQLPDLRGRVPIHMGTGTGLTQRIIGQSLGTEDVTLMTDTLPTHTHTLNATNATGTLYDPAGNILAGCTTTNALQSYNTTTGTPIAMNPAAIQSAGSSQPHNNMMPTLCINFIIALEGYYPQRP
jgi:microcystin-dependent protein